MYEAFASLAAENDHRILLLAVGICVFGAITAVRVFQRAERSSGSRRAAWLATSAVVGGSSLWSTHFIAILAFEPGFTTRYEPLPVAASLIVGVAAAGLGFAAALRPERWAPWVGGAILGYGVAAMHYIGIGGVVLPGRFSWEPLALAASVGFALIFATISLVAVRRLPEDRALLTGSAALALGILTLHFASMSALVVVPEPRTVLAPALPDLVLASGVAVSTCFLLAIAVVSVMFDGRMLRGREEAEQRIRHMAYHDLLTGLPNRAYLDDVLKERLEAAERSGGQVAVLALDLDRFKQVNDIFGHQAGDGLLRHLAFAMSAQLQPNEFLARLGGDEFVVVQSGVAQPEGAKKLAQRLINAVCGEIELEGVTFRAATSIGIALFPRHGRDAIALYPNADAALYRAKQEGRGTCRLFEPEMDLALRQRRALQIEMRDALKRGEFKLYYQPQAETMTGVISGFEALIRWEHPKRGLISPAEFISAAEENGFIVELGEFVLRTACAEAASWAKPLNISVNLSPVQFQHGDIVALVQSVLEETGLDPTRLELEITESLLIQDFGRALSTLGDIKKLGVCVAMDDFGTGYSSLAYLQAFPFDRIKIDRSFVAGLDGNKQSEAIIRAIVGLGRGLDVPVTAEGVENETQQAFLAELDCAEIQGFLIGKPQPIELLEMHTGRNERAMPVRKQAAG